MSTQKFDDLKELLNRALDARYDLLDEDRTTAIRLFSGFFEGCPELVVDLYAHTLVLYGYGSSPEVMGTFLENVRAYLLERLTWVECVVQKNRAARDPIQRRGIVTFGGSPARQVREGGVWYAFDLSMHQDAGFYLDTRNLRRWLQENAAGWSVLNTFAYTGSLGVAALAGGAVHVVQVDRSRKFLVIARRSAMLSHLDLGKMRLRAGDFFSQTAFYKRSGELFDCVIVDPPFFSSTEKGTVDLVKKSTRVINKVRPLVRDGGRLVAINNALFLSGAAYMRALERLCEDGYLIIETLIPVPVDVTGYPHTILRPPPEDPSPFNHPTKIAILKVRRK
jgi:23S rRNA (cytosine1962-C5)-methyltransferase